MKHPTATASMTLPDDRFPRCYRWFEDNERLAEYLVVALGKNAWKLALRLRETLNSAVFLISDRQLDQLLGLLEHLGPEAFVFSRDTTARLGELSDYDFSRFVMRQIAIAVADPQTSVEDMAAGWRRGFRFEAQPGEGTGHTVT